VTLLDVVTEAVAVGLVEAVPDTCWLCDVDTDRVIDDDGVSGDNVTENDPP
jgi:hypothetical protein